MGQFLWVEDKVPEQPMPGTMRAFLMSGSRDFDRAERSPRPSLGDHDDPTPSSKPHSAAA